MTRNVTLLNDESVSAAADDAGFGALECSHGRLPLVAMDVNAVIVDLTAETTVRQTFRNSLSETIEATYIFPLPDRAAVTKFEMRMGGRTIEGQLRERQQAREEYDRAIDQGHRAAIAEEERSGVFTLRVGNIPPGETASIELTLVGPLPVSNGEATFQFPLVVAPRYTPGLPLDGEAVGAGVAADTDQVPDASRVTPPVLLPGFPNPVRLSLQVAIDAAYATDAAWISDVTSSLHATVTSEGQPWTFSLQPGERLNRDFILRFPVARRSIASSLTASAATEAQPGTFGLTVYPPKPADDAKRRRRIVFLLDRSASMSGWKMVAARRAVGRMVDSLRSHDEFLVVAFDCQTTTSREQFVPGTNRERWNAVEWLGGIEARGGTELDPAIHHAMNELHSATQAEDFENILVVVTDGQVTGEDVVLREAAGHLDACRTRIFCVGIDRAVNAGFLRRLADLGGGACEFVESEDRLDDAMDSIHRLVGHPVLTNVRVIHTDTEVVADSVAPSRLPDMFADRPVTIFGRHRSADGNLRLTITATNADGTPWTADAVAARANPESLLSMWGRSRVRDLEDAYAAGSNPRPQELMQQIVDVSLEAHVLSRFTAYVAVDEAEVVNEQGRPHPVTQPVEYPAGWDGRAEMHSLGATREPRICGMMASVPDSDATSYTLFNLASLFESDSSTSNIIGAFPPAPERRTVSWDAPEGLDNATEKASATAFLLQITLSEALSMQATEILIETRRNGFSLQYRVNGSLVDGACTPMSLLRDLVRLLRALAGILDSDQTTGTFSVSVNGQPHSFRMTITSNKYGDCVRLVSLESGSQQPSPAAEDQRGDRRFWT